MGKTYKSFDKFESFDYHDGYEEKSHKKYKKNQVRHYTEVHKDKKRELLESLPGANNIGSDDWRYDD